MTDQDLRLAIKSQVDEFEPVRLYLSNGSTLDVTHPEAIMIGPSSCAILINGSIGWVSNFHINRVELLKAVRT